MKTFDIIILVLFEVTQGFAVLLAAADLALLSEYRNDAFLFWPLLILYILSLLLKFKIKTKSALLFSLPIDTIVFAITVWNIYKTNGLQLFLVFPLNILTLTLLLTLLIRIFKQIYSCVKANA